MWPLSLEREYAERERERALELTATPRQHPSGHERVGESLVIYDDPDTADALAREYGTRARHAHPKKPHAASLCWQTFSVVQLPTR